jgi:hypothetical protein
MLSDLARIRNRKTGRVSSWDKTGRNADLWVVPARSSVVLADITGPAQITHIWMTQLHHYRECLLKITYDDASFPSVLAPLGDFFCMGHGLVNSFQNALFSASTFFDHQFNKPCALNCYAPMPFGKRAVVELVNESDEPHRQYFYVDYETLEEFPENMGYFHAEFRRANPFRGWAPEIGVNAPEADVPNEGRTAWENNYIILETKGYGQYIGCNLSVTNFTGNWWGEGDDMIWVDGYKWPPDLHGTGSEDYFSQAWGMQPNAYLRNGSWKTRCALHKKSRPPSKSAMPTTWGMKSAAWLTGMRRGHHWLAQCHPSPSAWLCAAITPVNGSKTPKANAPAKQ